jgi:kumamolisin
MTTFSTLRYAVLTLLLPVLTANLPASIAPASVVLSGSTAPVGSAAGTTGSHKAVITRQNLTAAETSAPLEFEVALKMHNFSDLQSRVGRGEHIPPAEMAAKYEPSAADYQSVVDWLKGEGFTITRQDPHHLAVFARGKISQVAKALQVTFARVSFQGGDYTSAITAPSVPATLSPLLMGINGLQPHLRMHKHLLKQQVQPNASTGSASYTPPQIAQAYGATGLYNNQITGGGQTIAIVIDTFPSTTDLELFWKNANISQSISNIQFIQTVAGTLNTPTGEESLDVEWASGMAPGAHVRVYATVGLSTSQLDQAYAQVLNDATNHPEYGIHQMSMSYGEGETDIQNDQSQINTDDQYFAELAAAGVTLFASSGDGGATPGSGSAGDESGPVQVESPASDPNVTAVGGTSLQLNGSNNIISETVWNNSSGATGGGTSILFSRPTWQTGTGVPAGTFREVPDIAAAADPTFGAIVYLNGLQTTYGGTSWASPTWAGLCALMNQARANAGQNPLGLLGPSIYPLLGTANYAADIRDIISGNNDTNGLSNGFSAQTGYDMVSGLGSPKTQALAQTLLGSATEIGIQMPAPEQLVTLGQNAIFSVAVGGTSATYQWQRMPAGSSSWSNLTDSSTYSGSTTASLQISGATSVMNGDRFQCLITLSGGSVKTSSAAVLSVTVPLVVSTLAGSVGIGKLQNGSGTGADFSVPSGIAIDGTGNLYVADYSNNAIRKVTTGGVVTTPYGTVFNTPNGVAADNNANVLYVADTGNNLIDKISGTNVTTFAGAGGTLFNSPEGIAVDGSGNVYVADTLNDVIRKITSAGVVSIIAGQSGTSGYQDGNALTQALFNSPVSVAVDGTGNVYVADFGNYVVRKISGSSVSTLAGQGGTGGYLDGPSSVALFNSPAGVTVDGTGNVYVADSLNYVVSTQNGTISSNDTGNNLLRKITPSGIVTTLAGQAGYAGSADGTGTGAQFDSLQAVAIGSSGTFYLADAFNQTIREGVLLSFPAVSITATQPNALVPGPINGQFTLTRTGDTSNALSITYTATGSATSGTDYTALPATLTIPAGASTANVTIVPKENNLASSNPTLVLTLTGNNGYTIGNPSSATVTIEESTPFLVWAESEFGNNAAVTSIGGPLADPNNNGVPNFLEYAFNSDPLVGGTDPSPTFSLVEDNGSEYLAITYTALNTDPNLTFTVQVTSDLAQQTDQWHSGNTYTTVVSQTTSGNVTQYTVRDDTPYTAGTMRFIRLQVSGE